jgi:hypothetical protein
LKQKTERHPVYGEIPLVKITNPGRDGKLWSYYIYDPSFQPKLPVGAIRGDVSKQEFCSACHVPKYFYLDETRTCVQCGEKFIFGAKEQKYWYEHLKFNFHSVAIRCKRCRKSRRSEAALRQEIAMVLSQLRSHPHESHLLLALAKTTIQYRAMVGEGDLDRAIAACRGVSSTCPEHAEALYWEARCHLLAGRDAKARQLFQKFLDSSDSLDVDLRREAKAHLKRGA